MMLASAGILSLTVSIAFAMLSLSLILALIRLILGPSLPDRVVALDFLVTLVLAMIGVYSIATGEVFMLRPAIILALLSFLGTVAFAYYLEKRGAS
jgi:multicomponent Na+:H+ antiporter subunit F